MDTIPPFLQPTSVAGLSTVLGDAADAASRSNQVRGFSMTCQQEDLWCWAAVTQAVERWASNEVSQSMIASDHVANGEGLICATPLEEDDGGQDCGVCLSPLPGCGGLHSLRCIWEGRAPQRLVRVFKEVDFEDIVGAIDDQRPLPVRIEWHTEGGHFICVTGYRVTATDRYVTIHDPMVPRVNGGRAEDIEMSWDGFSTEYRGASGDMGQPKQCYEVSR